MALFQDKKWCSFEQCASLEIQIDMVVLHNPNSHQKSFRCHVYVCDHALTCITYFYLHIVKQGNIRIICMRLLEQVRLKRNQWPAETFKSSIICKSCMENIIRLKEQYFLIQLAQFVTDRTQVLIGKKNHPLFSQGGYITDEKPIQWKNICYICQVGFNFYLK